MEHGAYGGTPTLNGAPSGAPGAPCRWTPASQERPLWLTEHEAQTLVSLCAASPTDAEREHDLFRKLGEYLRSFHQ